MARRRDPITTNRSAAGSVARVTTTITPIHTRERIRKSGPARRSATSTPRPLGVGRIRRQTHPTGACHLMSMAQRMSRQQ